MTTLKRLTWGLHDGPYKEEVVRGYWRRRELEALPCVLDKTHAWHGRCWRCAPDYRPFWRAALERRGR